MFENILDPEMVDRLRAVTDQVLDAQTEAHFKDHPSTGSMVRVDQYPFMAALIAYPKALATLAGLGFDDPKWWSGYIISKPPHSPPLFWHQDGLFWDHPISYTTQPQQWFLMYYLVDTTPENGCLRLIPGSHLNRHPLHDQVSEAHREELRHMTNSVRPAYKLAAGEVDVPVKAGDLVIGDARLLHAAHGNTSISTQNRYHAVVLSGLGWLTRIHPSLCRSKSEPNLAGSLVSTDAGFNRTPETGL